MGKRQHQKDKMYLTSTEWATLYGGYKKSSHSGAKAAFRRLPYSHCTLSLLPYNHPYCDPKGNIFDLEALLPWLRKFKVNPVTGEPLSDKNLLKLNFHRGSAGEYHCPVLYKPFSNHTHFVAIKTTGNVFSYEAIDQLNIKVNNWRELLTDTTFTRADIIVLQDPAEQEKFNISSFHHVKKDLRLNKEGSGANRDKLKNVSRDTQAILEEFKETYKEPENKDDNTERKADKFNAAHYSTGAVSASFTSTAVEVATTHEAAVLEDSVVRYQRVKKKGYVSLKTNHGTLNLEVYCDTVRKASENFLRLCEKGYYNGTIFHRSIRHFMLQGGDPTGTGSGGESIWGEPFKDEFRPNLSHKGRGVLSMANSGPDTNKSQFFITYRSCPHLDPKHTIFGRVVGGIATLSSIEAIETDNKDKPIEDIIIQSTSIFVDPFKEADQEIAEERRIDAAKRQAEDDELKSRKKPKKKEEVQVFRSGIGKFLDLSKATVSKEEAVSLTQSKKSKASYGFNDFSIF